MTVQTVQTVQIFTMPVCSICNQDNPKSDYSQSQLKKRAQRCCSACLAAAEMAAKMEELPLPSLEDAAKMEASCRVEERPDGRVLVAARDFKAGDIVLREPPTLFWSADNVGDLVSGFLALQPEEQREVLEMATPNLESDLDKVVGLAERARQLAARKERQAARRGLAEEIAKGYADNPRLLELIETLLYIGDCNAHAFQGDVGLFPLAALANHACDPSCGHTTKVANEMRFIAVRPIKAGDEISISYLPEVWATPCEQRRKTLLLQKLIFCRCARCLGPDHCRGLRCVASACSGVAVRGEAGNPWVCGTCKAEASDASMEARVAAETKLLAKAKSLAAGLERGHLAATAAHADAQALLKEARDELSPSHYIGPSLLSAIGAAPGLDPQVHASVAAQALAWLECASAGCHAPDCARAGVTRHAPNSELVGEAVTAALLAARVGSKEMLALSAVISSRYVLLATRQFGPEDRSVKAMRTVLDKVVPTGTKTADGQVMM